MKIATSSPTNAEPDSGAIELFAAAPQTLMRFLCRFAEALGISTYLGRSSWLSDSRVPPYSQYHSSLRAPRRHIQGARVLRRPL